MISAFDIFKIGIGPSSSHTVGPMNAGKSFIDQLVSSGELHQTTRIVVDLYGSLSLTGKGHATDVAIMMGLAGNSPQNVQIDTIAGFTQTWPEPDVSRWQRARISLISLLLRTFSSIAKRSRAMKMVCVSPRGTATRRY